MNFPKTTQAEIQPKIEPVQAILKAQDTKHKGSLFGIINRGGKISIDGFILEVVADNSDYRTLQIYECAKGITPKVQYYRQVKKQVVKKEVYKKPKPKQETIKVDTKVHEESLF